MTTKRSTDSWERKRYLKRLHNKLAKLVQCSIAVSFVQHDIELVDPRGRTPLHLAVSLGRVKCVEALLNHKANPLAVNRHHWAGMCTLV